MIYVDDIRITSAGQPLQAESAPDGTDAGQPVTQPVISAVVEAAQLGWIGLIGAPDRITGFAAGNLGVTTSDFDPAKDSGIADEAGNAGGPQRGLDDQGFFAYFKNSFLSHDQIAAHSGVNWIVRGFAYAAGLEANQIGGDDHTSLSPDGHPVQSHDDSGLLQRQHATLMHIIVDPTATFQANIGDCGATIDHGAIGVPNFNISSDFASPGGNGLVADRKILQLEELSLQPLETLSQLGRDLDRFIAANLFFDQARTAHLGQGKKEHEQEPGQHVSSVGLSSDTLPPDRNLVNNSDAINSQSSALSAEQLALLGKATINIADLADGYLALTTGTTITLDTDAAGYGWFIDPTPLLSEEFAASATSPWQFAALEGGAAAGKIDLMTVLMHELGHVMGLDHVSSAVDSTRLMAGSIDPGIRRLPSSFDLGPVESSHEHNSELSTQNSAPDVWAPYLTHYTVTASGEQTPAPVINPAQLVQAAQLPSHAGIFNSHFAISDQPSANFGWDESGAVTIANGQAVLSEDHNVISTLSQLFTLPTGSTHLRFTLVDADLDTNGANRPSDAFEVAFLEASTLTPLAGVTAGLTQTDSLFNLQQDGTVRFSNRVTLSNRTLSGSTLDLTRPVIVDIDLTGITAGAGARLSFDLLGFGDRTSTVVIDNVLLTNGQATAAPVAVGDHYTVAEGATLTITAPGLLANDTDSDTSAAGLAAALLTGPLHGTLTINTEAASPIAMTAARRSAMRSPIK